MLKIGMYVRSSIDSDEKNPREFILGKIASIDDFSQNVNVIFLDCNNVSVFYPLNEKNKNYKINKVSHCKIKNNARVMHNDCYYYVKSCKKIENNEYFYYYLQDFRGDISLVCEKEIIATFNDAYYNPVNQLFRYEFQNPMWFIGRNIVSRTMNIINNSLYGFKELAGCKIMLKPHQIKTVMRCLKDSKCRVMIADEVGLGKTIEAICVLKIFLLDKNNQKVLITVPDALIEQWKTELAFKFKLFEGFNINNNYIKLVGISDIYKFNEKFDLIIVDEVHRYLENSNIYKTLLNLSENASNIIMLSATPLQKRNNEYKKLLSLIQPDKYCKINDTEFNKLLESQNEIIRLIYNSLDEFDALKEAIYNNDNILNDEVEENFESTISELEDLQNVILDSYFDKLMSKIDIKDNFGINSIQNCIAYVCENYQLEKSIIRNRRKKISIDEKANARSLIDISYEVDSEFNSNEWNVFKSYSNWIDNLKDDLEFKKEIVPLTARLFSSSAAFLTKINEMKSRFSIDDNLIKYAERYAYDEQKRISQINRYLEDPEMFACKLVNIIDYLDQECDDKKVLIFTSFDETFELYKNVLKSYFGDSCCYFNKKMSKDELELNVYKFQNHNECKIMLSDESGGEGRNFQNADLLIHLDIPWSANDLEQRIGRLDRIGRNLNKDVVSVVCYGKETTEESLFNIWNNGLKIFTQSQSGLEIIMSEIDNKIVSSLQQSFKYGLDMAKSELEQIIKIQTGALKKEQVFDIAGYQYQELNRILDDTIEKFNENETELFGKAMMSWAALSGFNGIKDSDDTVTFSYSSISLKSLSNTLFIPPNMKALIDDKLNELRNRIRCLANDRKKVVDNSYIRGTFNRMKALSNDYINFFAPGDDIFDCITNNALDSYKGTCSAFSVKGKFNWSGFVFTWKIKLDENLIYDNNLPSHILDQYKGFIPSNQIITPYDLSSSMVDEKKVISEFTRIINNCLGNYANISHLGKRSGGIIEKFKLKFPKDKWRGIVDEAYTSSLDNAKLKFSIARKSLLLSLKKELVSLISAEKAISKYYNSNDLTEKVEFENKIIYDIIAKASIVLDSVCYMEIKDE